MPVPGYDPDDIDDQLESALTESEIRERLTDEGFEAYENGEPLFELLDADEIDDVLSEE